MSGDGWRREAERLAWWAWLVCRDDRLASRLADLRGPVPPWLGPTALLVIGGTAGLAAGMLVLLMFPGVEHWRGDALALVMVLHFAGVLLARAEDEGPDKFPDRVAAALLHAPYLLLAAMAWLNLWQDFANSFGIGLRGGRDGLTAEFGLILVGLAVMVLVDIALCGPQSLRGSREDGVAGASFMLRLAAPLAFLLGLIFRQGALVRAQMSEMSFFRGLFASYAILPEVRTGVMVALLAVVALRPYELFCERLADLLFGGPSARSRGWPSWLGPPPMALETRLLASPRSHDWNLAAELALDGGTPPGRLVVIGRRAWDQGEAGPAQVRLAALGAAAAWQADHQPVSKAGWALLEEILRSGHPALDGAFWSWLAIAVRQRRADLVRWILRERQAIALPRHELLAVLRPLRWTTVLDQADDEGRRELIGELFGLLTEVRSVALLEQALRDLDLWREQQRNPEDLLAPPLLARWTRVILETGRTPDDPVLAHAATLRRAALRAADGDAGAARTWYALARRFEELPVSRQRDVLLPFAYRELWRMVLDRFPDEEEELRQTERYQKTRYRRRRTGEIEVEPEE